MKNLYTANQTRQLDQVAISGGIAGFTLMQRAGAFCFQVIRANWPEQRSIVVLCGSGNNGGDGFVVADLAHQAGWDVRLVCLKALDDLHGEARQAADAYVREGGVCESWSHFDCAETVQNTVVIDALLGTGVSRQIGGAYAQAVSWINQQEAPVLSVDVPSGVCADSGKVLGDAVQASVTVSFIGRKRGLETGPALDLTGNRVFHDLAVPEATFSEVASNCSLLEVSDLACLLPPRELDSHKGNYGRVLVVGGNQGMPGAVILAGRAALRSGAGLVKLVTHPSHAGQITLNCPELMSLPYHPGADLEHQIDWADVIAFGPGLGVDCWSESLLKAVFSKQKTMVVDADALRLLASNQLTSNSWILTPHPGEAAALLDTTIGQIQADRFAAAAEISNRYGGVCVLKGAGTVISDGNEYGVCPFGNPGMATAGMGDVLTGVIGASAAQTDSLMAAAQFGVLAHALAGDSAAVFGRGLIASDVIQRLPEVVG